MGRLGCGTATAKYLLCLSNSIFMLVSIAMIGLGAWALSSDDHFPAHLQDKLDIPGHDLAIGLIALGVFVLFVSLFGACGSFLESKCLLVVYTLIVFVLIAGQVTVGVLSMTNSAAFSQDLVTQMDKLPSEAQCDVERWFECAGFGEKHQRPQNCTDLGFMITTSTPNCDDAVKDWLRENLKLVSYTALASGSFQLLCLVFAIGLLCALPSKAEEYRRLVDQARESNRKYARA